ncbi:hypothetical protein, partial [uncultured Bacteroides sp.]|uniref:hypothetical protein n=1 Tax=uncultured Bacteroides sp. TaxID=162156 RepID=UPI00260BEFE6
CLKEFNTFILHESNGLYQVGAGVRLQALIKQINEDGYGGIEYLWSVPGLTGGGYSDECRKRKNTA